MTAPEIVAETVETPEVVEAPEQVEAKPEAPKAPLSRREARQGLRTPKVEEAKPEKPPEEPPEEPPAAEVPPEEQPEAAAKPEEAKPDEKPVERISIPIPEGHPLREMGRDSLTAADPHEERVVRALINGVYTRRQQVEALEKQNLELQDNLARREAQEAAREKWENAPGYKEHVERFHNLKQLEVDGTVPEGTASDYWKGYQTELSRMTDEEYQSRRQQIDQGQMERRFLEWKSEAWERANRLPQTICRMPEFQGWFERALKAFNAELDMQHFSHLKGPEDLHREFTNYFGARLIREKAVQAVYRQMEEDRKQKDAAAQAAARKREQDAIGKAAVTEFKTQAAAKRSEVPPHPLGSLPSTPRTTGPEGEVEDAERLRTMSPYEIRRQAKMGARQDARRHLGR